jgi:hypothetical protein
MWNVDAVQQGVGNLRDVALNDHWRAMAFSCPVIKEPRGQGFIAATSMNRAGKLNDIGARAIVRLPSFRMFAGAKLIVVILGGMS